MACGAGTDTVYADKADIFGGECTASLEKNEPRHAMWYVFGLRIAPSTLLMPEAAVCRRPTVLLQAASSAAPVVLVDRFVESSRRFLHLWC